MRDASVESGDDFLFLGRSCVSSCLIFSGFSPGLSFNKLSPHKELVGVPNRSLRSSDIGSENNGEFALIGLDLSGLTDRRDVKMEGNGPRR